MIQTIIWTNGAVKIIDQTKLPGQLKYIYCCDLKTLWEAIKMLRVRGAPALGAAAGFGVLLASELFKGKSRREFDAYIKKSSAYLATSRPTAVNLFNALKQMQSVLTNHPQASLNQIKTLIKREAFKIYETDRQVCRQMGNYGAQLIKPGANVMTICNAGALATVDYGTALGVFYSAKRMKKNFSVYTCETRPLLQGARLTTWELLKNGIDTTLICDNMAATVMRQKNIAAIFTGADRIAANGDAANKIGTYSLAVLAKHHKIPFYVVAPFSTFDMTIPNGRHIPIEQRDKSEVLGFGREKTAPAQVKVFNPAFDVTDHRLITAIITEAGIISPVNARTVRKIFPRNYA